MELHARLLLRCSCHTNLVESSDSSCRGNANIASHCVITASMPVPRLRFIEDGSVEVAEEDGTQHPLPALEGNSVAAELLEG
eukprot:1777120-Amphidinium_carterae.1